MTNIAKRHRGNNKIDQSLLFLDPFYYFIIIILFFFCVPRLTSAIPHYYTISLGRIFEQLFRGFRVVVQAKHGEMFIINRNQPPPEHPVSTRLEMSGYQKKKKN